MSFPLSRRAAVTRTATRNAKSASAAGVADGSTIAVTSSTSSRASAAERCEPDHARARPLACISWVSVHMGDFSSQSKRLPEAALSLSVGKG